MNTIPEQFARFVSQTPKCEIVTLDKPLVDWLLSINTDNRPIKPNVVNNYEQEMISGEWYVTGQGISISTEGILLDGQHRLLAAKKAGYPPVQVCIVYGVDKRAQIKVDTHAKRSANDLLALYLHIKASKLLGPALKATIYMTSRTFGMRNGVGVADLGDAYYEYADDWDNIPTKSGKAGVAGALAGCCMFATHNGANKNSVADFYARVLSGENIDKTNPIYWVRSVKEDWDKNAKGYQASAEWLMIIAKALALHLRVETRSVFNKPPKNFKEVVDELEMTARSNRAIATA
jgi:hypothetical protein